MRAELVRYVFAVWSVLMCAIITAPAASAERDVKLIKKDGAYKGTISSDWITPTDGFVKDIELSFAWTALDKQPIEYYVFKWNRTGTVFNAGTPYSRSQFAKYPDLLKRFDDIRPGNMKLSMSVDFAHHFKPNQLPVNGKCSVGILDTDKVWCRQSLTKSITEIPHLMVVKSGKLGDNITPTSPKDDWAGFFDTAHMSGSTAEINKELYRLMKNTNELRVYNLQLVSYTLPHTQISALIKEYNKREKKKDEEEEAGQEGDSNEADKQLDQKTDDDFWNGADSTSSPDVKSDDAFWAGGDETSKGTENKRRSFWDGDDRRPANEASDSDSFWDGKGHKVAHEKIIIESNGVKTNNGKILIPFRNWSILSFKDGIAKVKQEEEAQPVFTIKSCGTVTTYYKSEGYVDKSGAWIVPPKKELITKTSSHLFPPLTYCVGDNCNKSGNYVSPLTRCIRKLDAKASEIRATYN